MPKKRWSAHDERKYKTILRSCRLSQGRKKGATKICKRIAAATVERDLGMASLRGLGGMRGTPAQHAGQARLLMSEASSWGAREGPIAEMEFTARAAEEAQWSGDRDLERKADRMFSTAQRAAKATSLRGLACACEPTSTSLSGRKRKRKR